MKIKILATTVLSIGALMVLPFTASASSLESWTFYGPNPSGSSMGVSTLDSFSTPGSFKITLNAIENTTTGSPGFFYDKNQGDSTDEQGLGVIPTSGDTTHEEIDVGEAIKIIFPTGLTDFNLYFKSLSGNEYADIWAGSIGGTGTKLGEITHDSLDPVSIPEKFSIDNAYLGSPIFVTAQSKDFLLYGADATNPVPEPSTYLLLGFGLVGMGSLMWRKNRKEGDDLPLEFPY